MGAVMERCASRIGRSVLLCPLILWGLLLAVLSALPGCGPAWGEPATPIAASDALDLSHTHREGERVLLHLDLRRLRLSPRYAELRAEMEEHSGLSEETAEAAHPLLGRTEEAVGLLFEGEGQSEEGVLFVNGSYAPEDFDRLLELAAQEGGAAPRLLSSPGEWPTLYGLGQASLARFSTRSWAIGHGQRARAFLRGINQGGRDLRIDIGPRFGLPPEAIQAWADRDTPTGALALRTVMRTEAGEMVPNLVRFIRARLLGGRRAP
jgi:hypothetical protein